MTTEETTEAPATDTDTSSEAAATTTTPRLGLHTMLTRDSDMASRPGFRNPSNKRSKAQSKSKAKRGKKRR